MERSTERQDLPVRCPQCADSFVCRIQAGYSSCWCFELPNVCPVESDSDAGCLCPRCLEAKIAAGPQNSPSCQ